MRPRARQEEVLVRRMDDETIVYDQKRNHAYCLNRTAAFVWQQCDGQKTVPEIAALLQQELNPAADQDLVWVALDRLDAAHLLQEPLQRSLDQARASRRQFVRKVGLVGVLTTLLPAVILTPAPAVAQAVSGSS
jgi:hypothetical protein